MSVLQLRLAACAALICMAGTTCGKESPTTTVVPAAILAVAGDGQSGRAGHPLPSPLVVKVVDASGQGIGRTTVEWSVVSGGGSVSASSTRTDLTGHATVTWTLGTLTGVDTASAVASGLPTVRFSATRLTGPPASLAFRTYPDAAWSGEILAVDVAVIDADSQTVTAATDTITLALAAGPAGGALAGTTAMQALGGVSHFAVRIAQPGVGYVLRATMRDLSSEGAFFDVVPSMVRISAGGSYAPRNVSGAFTCGVASDGAAYCWGDNTFGSLGNGAMTDTVAPTPVSGELSFADISAGTCGLTTAGAAYCWGVDSNDGREVCFYYLGLSARRCNTTPVPLIGGLTFTAVGTREDYACGLTADGEVYCWLSPYLTPRLLTSGPAFAALTVGWGHACALTAGGAAYCWGDNFSGQLGTGDTTRSDDPRAVAGGLTFRSLSAGYSLTCGLAVGGAIYCWGNGTTTPVPAARGLTFESVSVGSGHACGVTTTGAAYCWGSDEYGQLGDGDTTSTDQPVAVAGGLAFAQVSAGGTHTCGITIDRVTYCWGSNADGELGSGPMRYGPQVCVGYPGYPAGAIGCSTTPVRVTPLTLRRSSAKLVPHSYDSRRSPGPPSSTYPHEGSPGSIPGGATPSAIR